VNAGNETDGGAWQAPPDSSADASQRSARAYFLDGVKIAAGGPTLFLGLTYLGIGALAFQANVSLGLVLASTVLMWAGPAQVILLAALINGLALPAIALSICLSSVRLMPMCVSLLPLLRPRKPSIATSLYTSHFIAVTAWVETIRRLPEMPVHGRLPLFMGIAHTLFAGAMIACAVGYLLAGALPLALAAGLLFVTPVYFTIALLRNARDAIDWLALGFGFALAPIVPMIFAAGFDLLALGLVGGTAAWLVQRYQRKSAERAP